jgi:hypothetical protein
MANDFADRLDTAIESFYQRLGDNISWYTRVADVRMDDTPNLKLVDLSGVTHYAAQVASPSANDIDYKGTAVASAAYEKLVTVTHKDLRDSPELAGQTANMLADAGISTIQNLFLTTLAALDSTAHPDDAYTATGGGSVYFADDFATPQAQINLLTTALSASSLSTARQTLREYLNKAGLPMALDMTPSNLRLVVPAALETTALDLTSGPGGEIYDGSALQSRSFGGILPVVIPAASDDNDWWLIHRPTSPLVMWIREAPYLQITRAEATGHWHFYAQLEAAVVLKPHEGGLVMSAVA